MANQYGIKEFIQVHTFDYINALQDFPQPFKVYKPLQSGNIKLEDNILIWNVVAGSTCGRTCDKCYAFKAYRYDGVQKKHFYNTWLALHKADYLKETIINQIVKSKNKDFVRIHGAGDFYSIDYVIMWAEIVAAVNAVRSDIVFYTYTKSKFEDELRMAGIIVNASLIKGLGKNYGKREKMEAFIEKNNCNSETKFVLCPATVKETKKATKCGRSCTACMTDKTKVLFVEH